MTCIAFQFAFSHAGRLEIELIEIRIRSARHYRRVRHRRPWAVGDTEPDHPSEAVRPQQSRMPSYRRAPIMPRNYRLLFAERVQQSHHIAN